MSARNCVNEICFCFKGGGPVLHGGLHGRSIRKVSRFLFFIAVFKKRNFKVPLKSNSRLKSHLLKRVAESHISFELVVMTSSSSVWSGYYEYTAVLIKTRNQKYFFHRHETSGPADARPSWLVTTRPHGARLRNRRSNFDLILDPPKHFDRQNKSAQFKRAGAGVRWRGERERARVCPGYRGRAGKQRLLNVRLWRHL